MEVPARGNRTRGKERKNFQYQPYSGVEDPVPICDDRTVFFKYVFLDVALSLSSIMLLELRYSRCNI